MKCQLESFTPSKIDESISSWTAIYYEMLIRILHSLTLSFGAWLLILAPNIIPLCTTIFVVSNVIIIIGLILVMLPNVILYLSWYIYFGLILIMAPNQYPGSLFINPLFAHIVLERSTDRE